MRTVKLFLFLMLMTSVAYSDTFTMDENHLKDVDGNIGIGTLYPRSALDVIGSASLNILTVGGVANSETAIALSDALIFLKLEDDAANTTITDSQSLVTCTSSVNTSTLTTTGHINKGFLFNSAVNVDCGTTIKPSGSFSFNAWVQSGSSADSTGTLFGNRSAVSPNIGWRLAKKSGAPSKASFQLDTGSQIVNVDTTTTINTGSFFMVTGTYDGVNACIYVNSIQEACSAITGDGGTGAGNFYLDFSPLSSTRWIGRLDNLNVWERKINQAEIDLLYNAGVGTDVLTGTSGAVTSTTEIIKTGSYHPLKVSSSSSGNGDYLVVQSNGNVGIGTHSPTYKTQVIGTISATAFVGNGAGLTGISGGSSQWQNGSVGINTTSPVGIGTVAPISELQVIGTVNATAFIGDGSGITNLGSSAWTDGGTNVYPSTTTDNVGIGTTTPTGRLSVGSTGQFSVTSTGQLSIASTVGSTDVINITGNSLTSGNVLDASTSSAATAPAIQLVSSNASMAQPTVLIQQAGTGLSLRVNDVASDTTPFAITAVGNVGIGTLDPQAQLDVRNQAVTPFMVNSGATVSTGDYFIVTSSGNVGIGTAFAPTNKIVIGAGAPFAGQILCVTTNGAVGTCTSAASVVASGNCACTAL